MRCANCGKEFGSGTNCQNCGIDRVAGLANYSGYDGHTRSGNPISVEKTEYIPNKITACYACGEIIPDNSEYCPHCGKELYVTCPKCGNIFSSQFKFCSQCGLERKEILCWKCSFCGYLDLDKTIDKCPKCGKSSWELIEF